MTAIRCLSPKNPMPEKITPAAAAESISELAQWKKIARDLATAITPEQMIAAYDAWRAVATDEQ